MFCSQCGHALTGPFCANCGARAPDAAAAIAPSPTVPTVPTVPQAPTAPVDWSQEVRYDTLIRLPEVRDRLARHAAMAAEHMSADDFLSIADKVMPLFGAASPVSLQKLGAAVVPVFAQLGLKTGKLVTATVSAPVGTTIVAALCSFARNGQAVRAVTQFDDGCLIDAILPSDFWSWEGSLYASIRRVSDSSASTQVELATKIGGQKFDWGKSARALDALLQDLKTTPG